MANFTSVKLTDERVLVRGTDVMGHEGETVLNSAQWNEVIAHTEHSLAVEDFDRAVEEFFAPLTAAAEKVSKQMTKPTDPLSYVVLHEGTEGVEGTDDVLVKLNKDSMILRLLESNDFDRLVWVGKELEILAADALIEVPMQPETQAALDDAVAEVTTTTDVPAEDEPTS